ncbi:MAG: reverse transcriptase-like protein [Thermoproteota archaeon]|jgi:ribonuclease HI|nr:reverse transcriptase-like protein [Thermoproteota archaeon]
MKEIVTVRFLGQCLPRNPRGIACYAYIIRNKEGHLLDESCGLAAEPNSPSSTNSVATYTALIRALEWLIKNRYRNDIIKVYGNSKLVISQINDGETAISSKSNKNNISKSTLSLYTKVMKMKAKFYYISFELNNDSNNRHIDDKEIEELSLLAYVEAKTKILEQSISGLNNNIDKNRQELKKKLFSTAAELMMAAAK